MLDLTQSEKRVLIIILAVILTAAGIQLINPSSSNLKTVDYAESDSVFSRLSHVRPQKHQLYQVQFNGQPTNSSGKIHTTQQNKKNLLVNINIATEKEFIQLPRIGPSIAQRILKFRETHGSFKSNKDLQKIKGIGPKTFERIKPYLQNLE